MAKRAHITGTADEQNDLFMEVYFDARLAVAELRLIEAQWEMQHFRDEPSSMGLWFMLRTAMQRRDDAIQALINCPAVTREQGRLLREMLRMAAQGDAR